jgi:hypothetical protein
MAAPVDGEESPELYAPGGLHPVHLDDKYHHGRYRILRKLGHGRNSTVWLVRDEQFVPPSLYTIYICECMSVCVGVCGCIMD